jgi:hypothetical protein
MAPDLAAGALDLDFLVFVTPLVLPVRDFVLVEERRRLLVRLEERFGLNSESFASSSSSSLWPV